MKKIIIKILLVVSLFTIINIGIVQQANAESGNTIKVTEKIPGANCKPDENFETTGLYKCTVERGFGSIMQIMGKLLKYFTFIAGLFAVLMLVVGGIMYSMGGADENLKTKSKEFITKSLLGLIVLLLSGTILYAVAPWVYK